VARLLESLGVVVMAQGRLAEADDRLHRALAMNRTIFGHEHTRVASNLFHLGTLRAAQGRHPEARALFLESVSIDRSVRPESEALAGRLMAVGRHLIEAGLHDDARLLFGEAVAIRIGLFGENDERTAAARDALEQAGSLRRVGAHP
jgi:tetratricopeptide (TPR) repeat protein